MITLRVQVAKSFREKTVGLIGSKTSYSLFLKTRFGIHTFGVLFPIDVLVLNSENRVVVIKESLVPNRIFFWNPRYSTIIELPEKTIKEKKIKIGDTISVVLMNTS